MVASHDLKHALHVLPCKIGSYAFSPRQYKMYVMTELGKYTLLVANGHLGLSKGYSCGLEMDCSLLQNSTRKTLSLPSPQCSL